MTEAKGARALRRWPHKGWHGADYTWQQLIGAPQICPLTVYSINGVVG
jgi:hypothetical protein